VSLKSNRTPEPVGVGCWAIFLVCGVGRGGLVCGRPLVGVRPGGTIGVSENSFYVWRRKLRSGRSATSLSKASPSESFIPLSIVESGGAGDRIEVELPCGAVVRVPGDEPLIRQTLEVLLEFGLADTESEAASAGDSSC
jgi:hypothetical protein